jgi:hypothetical protein
MGGRAACLAEATATATVVWVVLVATIMAVTLGAAMLGTQRALIEHPSPSERRRVH